MRAHLEGEWHAATGTAGLEWQPGEGMLAYAKYTRGYKSGGFNAGAMAPGRTGYTDPEFINAYEIGLKETFAQRLTANVSVFMYDYKDAQYPSTVRDPATGLLESRFFNLDKATSMGAELETVWAVTDSFVVRLNYSYLDTEIEDQALLHRRCRHGHRRRAAAGCAAVHDAGARSRRPASCSTAASCRARRRTRSRSTRTTRGSPGSAT